MDADLLIGDTNADLTHYLSIARASSTVQNWLNIWKPVITASVKKAKMSSIQGVEKLQSYFRQTRAPATRTPAERLRASQPCDPTAQRKSALSIIPPSRYRSLLPFFGPKDNPPTPPAQHATQTRAVRASNSGFTAVRDGTRHQPQPDSPATTNF
jgi:hypothetical protein